MLTFLLQALILLTNLFVWLEKEGLTAHLFVHPLLVCERKVDREWTNNLEEVSTMP